MIDTHAHLQWPDFDRDREFVIERASAAGVQEILGVGYDLKASCEAVQIANNHDGVYAVVGIHPHNAKTVNSEALDSLRRLTQERKVVAVGEIGLDYYRDLSPRTLQKQAFEQQMHLARELQLPVVIHDREAHADVFEVLRKHKNEIFGVLHCFSGSLQMAEDAIKLGYLISVAGPVTFPNARSLHQVAKQLPLESIVLETDCPWLAPQSKRGKRNETAFIIETARKVAELRGLSLDELMKATSQNAKRLFRIP